MTATSPPQDVIYPLPGTDAQALSAIYEQYAPGIYRYIYYRVGDAELARDLQADVFVRMLEGIASYEDRGWTIGAWLYRIANARTVDCLRRDRRVVHRPLLDDLVAVAGPDETIEREQICAVVTRATAELSDLQRQVLLLRTSYGLSLDETARQLGRSRGAIKALQHRAIDRLRALVSAELGEADAEDLLSGVSALLPTR